MTLRKFYSVFGGLILAMAVSSCSTQTLVSRATGLRGVEPVGQTYPALTPDITTVQNPALTSAPAPGLAPAPALGPAPVPVPSPAVSPHPVVSSVASESARAKAIRESAPRDLVVRTTAYSHQERDSWEYGRSSAAGSTLKYGRKERSAAADWSRYPVGTRFKIKGLSQEYVVDDYGRALVGSDTIDIYKPTLSSMRQWGTRHVGITVLEWGSFSESERILESRAHKAEHVRQMLEVIQKKIIQIPAELWDGFSV